MPSAHGRKILQLWIDGSGVSKGRHAIPRLAVSHDHGSKRELDAITKRHCTNRDRLALDEGSVLAAEILDERTRTAHENACVPARHHRIVEAYVRGLVAADDVLAARE